MLFRSREGLGRRERSTEDRRVVYIRLTDKGARLAQRTSIEPMEVFRGALATLTPADVHDLLRILAKLEKSVRAQVGGVEPPRVEATNTKRTRESQ